MQEPQSLRELIEALRREMLLQFDNIRRELDQKHVEFREKQTEMMTRLTSLENWRLEFTEKQILRQDDQHSQRDRASLSTWQGLAISILMLVMSIVISYLISHH